MIVITSADQFIKLMLEARIEFEISNTDDIFRVSSQYNERSAVAYHADLIKAMNTVWKSL